MNQWTGLTRRLAEHAAGLTVDQIPASALAATRSTISDALACAIAGSVVADDIVGPVSALVADTSGGRSTSILTGGSLPAVDAAFLNGAIVHTIDFDDTLMAVVAHLGSSVVTSALAACEHVGASAETFLAAVVAGFDVGGRVGRAVMPQHYQRWHATASLGGIASAAAASVALGLDAAATEMALGIAADDTGGTRVCIRQGDVTKSLHAAAASQKGMRAALLVHAGAIGPVGHLEHDFGFFWAYSDERDPHRLPEHLDDLGERWEVEENDLKAHPCILSSHTAVEGVVTLMSEHGLNVDGIESVELFQPPYSERHGVNYEPETAMAARLSVQYVVAAAIRHGKVGLEEFDGGAWLDPDVRRLMERITITPDPELSTRYPGQAPNRTCITTVGGSTHELEVGVALGSHLRPLQGDALREKHDALLAYRLDAAERERWHGAIDALGVGGDIADLTALFAAGRSEVQGR
ncbi:MmgE/PrpD family protein [Ilumatobacter coccineus]|uniref:2-methylcitrate dehydratase n=1 Tax=Ilumatobacter coccineus (strain NBRC 103263 / KCTC 29153 / YM16-304) TaxID=1313172 RepID=A0A6C7ECT7_ILUCY|nr:MmgE/PrpD family protein [Ilumatobacter coccineus]BAN04271.1 hypothetical protein YM304_39570 [Ilumatobacter coccineus YM16-304]